MVSNVHPVWSQLWSFQTSEPRRRLSRATTGQITFEPVMREAASAEASAFRG
jgi:hypothetical protein